MNTWRALGILALLVAVSFLSRWALLSRTIESSSNMDSLDSAIVQQMLPKTYLLSEGTKGFVECRLVLRNVSQSPKRLKVAGTDCSCVNARLANERIAPRGSTDLIVQIAVPAQAQSRVATIQLANLDDSKDRLMTVKAPVAFVEDVQLEPQSLHFKDSPDGKSRKSIVRVRRRPGGASFVKHPFASETPHWIQCRPRDIRPDMSVEGQFEVLEWLFEVELVSVPGPASEHFARVPVIVEGVGSAVLNCWADLRSGVVVAPTRITLARLDVGSQAVRRFVLRASDSEPFSIRRIVTSSPDVTVISKTTDLRNSHIFEATVAPAGFAESDYTITWETTHPKTKLVTATLTTMTTAPESSQ